MNFTKLLTGFIKNKVYVTFDWKDIVHFPYPVQVEREYTPHCNPSCLHYFSLGHLWEWHRENPRWLLMLSSTRWQYIMPLSELISSTMSDPDYVLSWGFLMDEMPFMQIGKRLNIIETVVNICSNIPFN